jgi:hypothetical protein
MSANIKLTRSMIQVTHDCDEIISEYRKQINDDIERFVTDDCDGVQVMTLLKVKFSNLEQKITDRLRKYTRFVGN